MQKLQGHNSSQDLSTSDVYLKIYSAYFLLFQNSFTSKQKKINFKTGRYVGGHVQHLMAEERKWFCNQRVAGFKNPKM